MSISPRVLRLQGCASNSACGRVATNWHREPDMYQSRHRRSKETKRGGFLGVRSERLDPAVAKKVPSVTSQVNRAVAWLLCSPQFQSGLEMGN